MLQNFDGSWGSEEVLVGLPVDQPRLHSLRGQMPLSLLLTLIVIEYFEKYCNLPRYALILKKARQWVGKQSRPDLLPLAKGLVL